jgi:hypothetical protein
MAKRSSPQTAARIKLARLKRNSASALLREIANAEGVDAARCARWTRMARMILPKPSDRDHDEDTAYCYDVKLGVIVSITLGPNSDQDYLRRVLCENALDYIKVLEECNTLEENARNMVDGWKLIDVNPL